MNFDWSLLVLLTHLIDLMIMIKYEFPVHILFNLPPIKLTSLEGFSDLGKIYCIVPGGTP